MGLIRDPESVASKILQNLGIDLAQVRTQLLRASNEFAAVAAAPRSDLKRSISNALSEFGTDLTQLAAEDKIDPVVGREKEIERVIQILGACRA